MRFTENDSDGGDTVVACDEAGLDRPWVTPVVAATHDDRHGQSGVECAAGYESGMVRIWRTRTNYTSQMQAGANSALQMDSTDRVAEAGAGVDESVVERHADTPRDYSTCLPASGDGSLLVSGSKGGVLCV